MFPCAAIWRAVILSIVNGLDTSNGECGGSNSSISSNSGSKFVKDSGEREGKDDLEVIFEQELRDCSGDVGLSVEVVELWSSNKDSSSDDLKGVGDENLCLGDELADKDKSGDFLGELSPEA